MSARPRRAAAAVPFPDDVDVAVVAFNARDTLPRLLECVRRSGAPDDRDHDLRHGQHGRHAAWLARAYPRVRTVRLADEQRTRSRAEPRPALGHAAVPPAARRRRVRAPGCAGAPARGARPVAAQSARPCPSSSTRTHPRRFSTPADRCTSSARRSIRGSIARSPSAAPSARDIGAAPASRTSSTSRCRGTSAISTIATSSARKTATSAIGCSSPATGWSKIPAAIVEHRSKPRTCLAVPCQIRNRWHFLLKNYELRTLLLLVPALAIHEPLQFVMLDRRRDTSRRT